MRGIRDNINHKSLSGLMVRTWSTETFWDANRQSLQKGENIGVFSPSGNSYLFITVRLNSTVAVPYFSSDGVVPVSEVLNNLIRIK